MKTIEKVTCALAITLTFSAASAQTPDMTIFNSNMRSKAANQFYQEDFKQIGAYKVKGNSNLLKGNNVTDIFSTIGYGSNLPIVFDVYTQQVMILQEDRKSVVKLTSEELDSFTVKIDKDLNFAQPAMFVNVERFEPAKKMYMQRLVHGPKANLYKAYRAEMRPAAMDVAQTNVREFEIVADYYYQDQKDKGTLVKIKPNLKNVKEHYETNSNALPLLEGSLKPEEKLTAFFTKINN